MKMTELRALDDAEARRRLRDLQEELFNLRFQYATRQLTNHARMQLVRRDIARIRTLLREREL
ncbi:MAG TPA: 50S ribosomal protein L29 [Chloroflexota bacterium]|nr:50S ribosomal protein L29 [Chloroflexota bacterium]